MASLLMYSVTAQAQRHTSGIVSQRRYRLFICTTCPHSLSYRFGKRTYERCNFPANLTSWYWLVFAARKLFLSSRIFSTAAELRGTVRVYRNKVGLDVKYACKADKIVRNDDPLPYAICDCTQLDPTYSGPQGHVEPVKNHSSGKAKIRECSTTTLPITL